MNRKILNLIAGAMLMPPMVFAGEEQKPNIVIFLVDDFGWKKQGYHTASIGKWHLGEDSVYWPEKQGFDLNVGGYSKGQPNNYFTDLTIRYPEKTLELNHLLKNWLKETNAQLPVPNAGFDPQKIDKKR